MRKKFILIAIITVCFVAGFFTGTYFMFNRITTSERYKKSVVEETVTDLAAQDGESLERLHVFGADNYPNFCWRYDVALFNPQLLEYLQKDAGKNYGKYYYTGQKIELDWHRDQSALIAECSESNSNIKEGGL